MDSNFSKYWHIPLYLLLPLISLAQKEHRYLVFEEKNGKRSEKAEEEVFLDSKGNFMKAFSFRGKDTLPIGKNYTCLNKDCIREQYKGQKIKEKRNEISVIELDQCHPTKTETTYFFEEEKLVKKVEKATPFLANQTLYFYDNRQKIALIVECLSNNLIVSTIQFDNQLDFEPDSVRYRIVEKRTFFDDGDITERKFIYIEQNN